MDKFFIMIHTMYVYTCQSLRKSAATKLSLEQDEEMMRTAMDLPGGQVSNIKKVNKISFEHQSV